MSRRARAGARRVRNARRAVQLGSTLLWVGLLFAGALAPGLGLPSDLVLSLDSVAALAAALAGRVLFPGLALALLTLASAVVLGRVFCGWVCPLGALLDFEAWLLSLAERAWRRVRHGRRRGRAAAPRLGALWAPERLRVLKFGVLLAVFGAAALGLQLAGFVSPLPLLSRAVALLGLPQVARPVAPPPPGMVAAARAALVLLGAILLLVPLAQRFWCRALCPLGGLLSLLARVARFRWSVQGCTGCGQCLHDCPMGIRSLERAADDAECIRCYRCSVACTVGVLGLAPAEGASASPAHQAPGPLPQRRLLLASAAGGLALGAGQRLLAAPPPPLPLRPPHAQAEAEFLARCVRCNACVRVCPQGTLRGFLLERGPLSLWTPELVPALGGCRADCDECAAVCPTGAIAPFDLGDKYATRVGLVRFERRYCVAMGPGARRCGRCIEVCPTEAFAVTGLEADWPRPRGVIEDRCVGCGLCEHACTVETQGWPALVVESRGRGSRTGLPPGLARQGKG